MRPALLLLALAGALMTGCMSDDDTPVAVEDAAAPVDAAAPGAESTSTRAAQTLELTGESHIEAAVGRPCGVGSTRTCPAGSIGAPAKFVVHEAAPVRATLVATWTAGTPLAETLNIRLFRDGSGWADASAVDVDAKSPFEVEVAVEALAEGGIFYAHGIPAKGGVAYDQTVAFTLALTYA